MIPSRRIRRAKHRFIPFAENTPPAAGLNGAAFLQFDATGEDRFLKLGRARTVEKMASHVSHIGVHDHGFNNVSTYGNLWRLMRESPYIVRGLCRAGFGGGWLAGKCE